MVLLVEDEELLKNLLEIVLTSNGISVIGASNGRDALEAYQSHYQNIELVLADLGLPEMDGHSLYERLREINPGVKVMITSGSHDPNICAEVLDKGACEFIHKPYDLDDILARVQKLMKLN